MSKISKTAKASAGLQAPKAAVVIPDAEMIRQLRINTDAGIFTGNTDFVRALFRAHDALQAEVNAFKEEAKAREYIASIP